MKAVHALSIALLLGLAAALGAVAGTRTLTAGHAQAAVRTRPKRAAGGEFDREPQGESQPLGAPAAARPSSQAAQAAQARPLRARAAPARAPVARAPDLRLATRRRAGAAHDLRARQSSAASGTDTSTTTKGPTEVATMTNHVARLYALATSLIVFFAVWLAVSAHPWSQTAKAAPAADPQIARLIARERRLAGGDAQGQPDRASALRRLSQSAQPAQPRQRRGPRAAQPPAGRRAPRGPGGPERGRAPTYSSAGGRAPGGAHRHLAPGRFDEDLVMLRRTFRAMGTDIECLLERPPRCGRRAGLRCRRSRIRTPRGCALPLPARLRALATQRGRRGDRRRRPPRARRGGRRGPRAHVRALRPDDPRRARRGGL